MTVFKRVPFKLSNNDFTFILDFLNKNFCVLNVKKLNKISCNKVLK